MNRRDHAARTATTKFNRREFKRDKPRIAAQSFSLRDATIGTGIAVDKMLALTGQTPAVAVQVVLPTPEERAERRARHAKLDEITRRLRGLQSSTGNPPIAS